ncbi:hypothetical protein [Piscinibacter sp. XHJ-5]|uniref:hypothetical protein n=1 Tax=Piscinibacter sp. XHJ-5 TaxID=3037797 RepID=UPI00245366DC|nr:hypothetical protein [Piscinibacter sp. XHJ-5]
MTRTAQSTLRRALLRMAPTMSAAAAACALLVVSTPAQPAPDGDAFAGIAAARVEQQLWREVYAGLARRADLGDADAARLALQMRRHGVAVYGTGFDASAAQLERWRQVAQRDDAACRCVG